MSGNYYLGLQPNSPLLASIQTSYLQGISVICNGIEKQSHLYLTGFKFCYDEHLYLFV